MIKTKSANLFKSYKEIRSKKKSVKVNVKMINLIFRMKIVVRFTKEAPTPIDYRTGNNFNFNYNHN